MPTPRTHGGSPLQYIPLNLPAYKGLNSQARGAVVGPEWATKAENTIIDDNNRLAARKGWNKITVTPAAEDFEQMVEFNNSGVMEIIATGSANAMFKSIDNGATWTTITGSATVTDPNMQFVILNGKLLGLQAAGGTIIKYTGTTFSDNGASGEPTGGIGVAAFGRVWIKDTATTLKYSALLDETDFTGTDSGTFDFTSVWQEQDEITAITSFNGALVIFSKRNILLYTDGQGSTLGLDPITAYLVDNVTGIGCVARDSVVNVKGDLWFLDDTGIHSLGRLLDEKSNPLNNISFNIQDEIRGRLDVMPDLSIIRAVYSPKDRFYLLCLPAGSGAVENGSVIAMDTRAALDQAGAFRCVGIWNQMVPRAIIVKENLDVVSTLLIKTGEVGKYTGNVDEADSYIMDFESGWTNLEDPHLKILKRISAIFVIGGDTVVNFKWGFDFADSLVNAASVTFTGGLVPSEWGTGEYDIAEYGAGFAALENKVGGRGTGEYIKVGFTVTINTVAVSCQQLNYYTKIGRLK